MKVHLLPSSNKGSRKHFVDTISKPVPTKLIKSFVGNTSITKPLTEKSYPCWGVTNGGKNKNKNYWLQMQEDDIALFYKNKKFFTSGLVLTKFHNRRFAKKLWNEKFNENLNIIETWENMFLLKEIKEIDIEIDVFNTLFGYKKTNLLFGYRVLDEVDSELLLDAFEIADHTFDSKNKKKKTTLKSNQKPAVNTTSKIVPIGKGTVFVTKGTVQQKDIVIKQTEKSLVNRFKAFLKKNKQGKLVKNQIKIKGENRPQETDGWIDSSKTLIEAKASPTRENIRMAIGQLLDYKRHHKPVPKRLAVLLPTFPRKDLADLLRSQKIDIIYEKNNKFVTKKNK